MGISFQDAFRQIMQGQSLSESEMHAVVGEIMDGRSEAMQTAGLLSVMAYRGETYAEIAGAARAMRERCTSIRQQGTGLLDTCGTGGSGLDTFNISTTAALVCASLGVPVAKHGNRSMSSTSGSADVLEKLGVSLELTPQQVDQAIEAVGLGFCFAPLLHQAMKNVGPIRRALGVRTIFNLLGPLTNPAQAEFQLLGTIRNEVAEKLAQALASLGTKRSLVVCGNNELDEISLWGTTRVYLAEAGTVQQWDWSARDFGLPACKISEIQVQDAVQSAAIIERVLSGEQGAARNMVLANAAAGLWVTGKVTTLPEGVELAARAIDQGEAQATLTRLSEFTHSVTLPSVAS